MQEFAVYVYLFIDVFLSIRLMAGRRNLKPRKPLEHKKYILMSQPPDHTNWQCEGFAALNSDWEDKSFALQVVICNVFFRVQLSG